MTPSPAQAEAIKAIVDWFPRARSGGAAEFYLAGYAGTGKSTTANSAIAALRQRYGLGIIRTGAYTGKAAHVLRKKGVGGAQTIHSMIYRRVEETDPVTKVKTATFKRAVDGPASECDLIVLDEVSMVAEAMARDVRSFGKPILVMGDPGQLPPVGGAGAFTRRAPDVFLSEIHRQAEGSPILRVATMARKDQDIPAGDYGDDCEVRELDRESQQLVYRTDTQVICGIHRVRWAYTQRLRARLGFKGRRIFTGERIICCKNDHDLGLFNGGLGVVLAPPIVKPKSKHLIMAVQMDDLPDPIEVEVHPYLFTQHFTGPSPKPDLHKGVSEFDWGYVLTCHKSQGSEWPHVTVIDDSASFREDSAKWLYTAVTRASQGLTLLKRAA